jgi:hypothetical protein
MESVRGSFLPVSFRSNYQGVIPIISENDIIGCDKDGNPIDKSNQKISTNPCKFGQKYDCFSKTCTYQGWFYFLVIGLPLIIVMILIFVIASYLYRKSVKKS